MMDGARAYLHRPTHPDPMHQNHRGGLLPIIILGVFYFIFGFVTWLNGTLIPYLKIACQLESDLQAYLVTFAFYISYFVMALPSSFVLRRTGFKGGMILGLLVMAVGALVFIQAAQVRSFALFLSGLFVIGTGLSLLQTAVNPYVTILGPMESAAKRISIMGICNKVAAVLGPLVLGAIVLHDADTLEGRIATLAGDERMAFLDALAGRVIMPYAVMIGVLVALAVFVRFSSLPEVEQERSPDRPEEGADSIFGHPNLVWGVLALFLYVGAEVIAGDTIPGFARASGIPLSEAKNYTSLTMAAMVLGYLIGIFTIPKVISQERALSISALSGIFFTLGAVFLGGKVAVLCIALLGLSNALVWPAIWPLAIAGLGKNIKVGSALLIMAIAGGALLPLLYAWLAGEQGMGWGEKGAYWMLVPCYLFILFYAIRGHSARRWQRA